MTRFTMLELLLVVTIVVTLLALFLPITSIATQRSQRNLCMNNLRQTGITFDAYAEEHDGDLPANRQYMPLVVAADGESNSDIRTDLLAYTRDTRVFFCPASPYVAPSAKEFAEFAYGKNTVHFQSYCLTAGYEPVPRTDGTTSQGLGQEPVFPADLRGADRADQVMAADVILARPVQLVGAPGIPGWAYHRNQGTCLGGNVLRGDGHVVWTPVAEAQPRVRLYRPGDARAITRFFW